MHKIKKGFTLIEVALAMTFVTVLSLIVVMLIVDAVTAYRRALTLNEINTTGMSLVEDIRTSIQGSSAKSLKEECTELYIGDPESACIDDGAKSFVMIEKKGKVKIKDSLKNTLANESDKEFETTLFGAYCTGNYTYLWNSGYYFRDDYQVEGDEVQAGIYLTQEGKTFPSGIKDGKGAKLLKVKDSNRSICKTVAGYNIGHKDIDDLYSKVDDYKFFDSIADAENSDFTGEIKLPSAVKLEEPVDLLESDDFTNLVIYNLSATMPAKVEGMNTSFSAASFILGTLQGGASINAAGNNCRVPTDYEYAEFNYCAINKFNFAAQAMGG